MAFTLPLAEMTKEDKLQAMEQLWQDLRRDDDSVDLPHWHESLLDERERQIGTGETNFIDWEQAKRDIRKQIR